LQSKEAIIKKLNNEIFELKSSLSITGKMNDVTSSSSQKNEVYYLKKEIEELKNTITQLTN
jgi:cob(I)alamin adenosyltransferase